MLKSVIKNELLNVGFSFNDEDVRYKFSEVHTECMNILIDQY
jgi:hypothetical protein